MQNLHGLAPMIKQTQSIVLSAGDGQLGMIDARDVAAVAAAVAVAPAVHAGRTYWLTGPDLISYTEVAKEFAATLGHAVEYRRIRPEEHRAAMIQAGVPEAVASTNTQGFGLIADGDAAWVTDHVESLAGSRPRNLHTFIFEHIHTFM
jgi:uncharacterized protein YbjT (DUF2867 family)